MTFQRTLVFAALSLSCALTMAQGQKGDRGAPGPCKAIEQACKKAGFIQGD